MLVLDSYPRPRNHIGRFKMLAHDGVGGRARTPLRVAAVIFAVVLPLALAGCGSERSSTDGAIDTDWFGSTSPQDILATATDAMGEPISVHLEQMARSKAGVVSKDLEVDADGDCTGQLQLPAWGEPADLVVRDGEGAFRGSRLFWFAFDLGEDSVAGVDLRVDLVNRYSDRWTTTPGLDTLCEIDDFLRPATKAARDEDLAKGGLSDVAGEPAGRVVSERGPTTVTTWVALAAPHRVLRIAITQGDGTGGPVEEQGDCVTTFSDFGAPVEVAFPAASDIETFELPALDLPAPS